MKETIKENLLSRRYWAALAFFGVTTFILLYMIFIKCEGEIYNHEAAKEYFDLWCTYNLLNIVTFGSVDGLKKVAEYLPNRNKPIPNEQQPS